MFWSGGELQPLGILDAVLSMLNVVLTCKSYNFYTSEHRGDSRGVGETEMASQDTCTNDSCTEGTRSHEVECSSFLELLANL